jgi:hypothetical protein
MGKPTLEDIIFGKTSRAHHTLKDYIVEAPCKIGALTVSGSERDGAISISA